MLKQRTSHTSGYLQGQFGTFAAIFHVNMVTKAGILSQTMMFFYPQQVVFVSEPNQITNTAVSPKKINLKKVLTRIVLQKRNLANVYSGRWVG